MISLTNDPIQELEKLCSSENHVLSSEELREQLEQIASTRQSSLACSHFLHELCRRSDITLEMAEIVLELVPHAAYLCTNKYHGRNVDMTDEELDAIQSCRTAKCELMSDRSYAIHVACANPDCPPEIICLLATSNSSALGHYCLIEGGCKPNADDEPVIGLPIHYYLAKSSNLDLYVVKYLVHANQSSLDECGASNPELFHPIHALMQNPNSKTNMEVIQYIVQVNPEVVKMKDIDSKLPIHMALENKKMSAKAIEFLLKTWPDSIFHRDLMYQFPLHKLCMTRREYNIEIFIDILKLLIETYPELLQTFSPIDGSYPIHLAARCQPSEFMKVLVDAYADSVKKLDGKSRLAFHIACEHGTVDTVRYLYNVAPESINASDNLGLGPIHFAAVHQNDPNVDVLKFLLAKDPVGASRAAELNGIRDDSVLYGTHDLQRYHGFLPLHYAADNRGSISAIRVLFDSYPDALNMEVKRLDPMTHRLRNPFSTYVSLSPRDLARKSHHEDAYKFFDETNMTLVSYRAFPRPLLCAIRGCLSLGEIKLFSMWFGNDQSICDGENNSPLHLACQYRRVDIVNFLLEQWPTNGLNQNCHGKYPFDVLMEASNFTDEDINAPEYVEATWRLLVANPQAFVNFVNSMD